MLLRVAEVEAVGDRERLAPGTGDVSCRFEDGQRSAGVRIESRDAARAVEADREPAERRPQPQNRGVEAGTADRARADEVVVAPEDPRPAANVRRGEELEQGAVGRRAGRGWRGLGRSPRLPWHLVARRLVGQVGRRDRADELAVEVRPQLAGVRHLADRRAVELPARADLLDGRHVLGPDDRDHPLLALGDHDLPRLQIGLPQRDPVERHVDSGSSARHLGERRGEAGGAEVLERLDEAALDELEARLDQLVAGERVADLHRGPLVRVLLAELLAREDAGAADPVAPCRRAVEEDDVARAGRARAEDPFGGEEADAHRVDQAVVRVGRVEDRVAADSRDADAVAIVGNAGHRALEMVVRLAEAEAVEQRDRPRTHRDDVAEDAADPGRGALERLDGGRDGCGSRP